VDQRRPASAAATTSTSSRRNTEPTASGYTASDVPCWKTGSGHGLFEARESRIYSQVSPLPPTTAAQVSISALEGRVQPMRCLSCPLEHGRGSFPRLHSEGSVLLFLQLFVFRVELFTLGVVLRLSFNCEDMLGWELFEYGRCLLAEVAAGVFDVLLHDRPPLHPAFVAVPLLGRPVDRPHDLYLGHHRGLFLLRLLALAATFRLSASAAILTQYDKPLPDK
jgi:hypothetical protein